MAWQKGSVAEGMRSNCLSQEVVLDATQRKGALSQKKNACEHVTLLLIWAKKCSPGNKKASWTREPPLLSLSPSPLYATHHGRGRPPSSLGGQGLTRLFSIPPRTVASIAMAKFTVLYGVVRIGGSTSSQIFVR